MVLLPAPAAPHPFGSVAAEVADMKAAMANGICFSLFIRNNFSSVEFNY